MREARSISLAGKVKTPLPSPLLIYFSPLPWRGLFQRPQHTVRLLSGRFRVLYVEAKTLHGDPPPEDADPLYHIALPVIPYNARNPALRLAARGANALGPGRRWLIRRQAALLSRKVEELGGGEVLLFFGHPEFYALRRLFPDASLVYDHMDDVLRFGSPPAQLRRDLGTLVREAAWVNATSRALARQMRDLGARHVMQYGNGVEWDRFALTGPLPAVPAELADLPEPRAIYAGSVAEWLDLELLFATAAELPDWSFPVLGPIRPSLSGRLRRAPANLHVLGPRPYAEVPAWLSHCQAALIPFRVNALTEAVDPVKLYEYLACGLPVLATPFSPEVRELAPAVALAESPGGFRAALQKIREAPPDPESQRALAAPRRWERQLQPLLEALTELASGYSEFP